MSDNYNNITGGKLKLKGGSNKTLKVKKKKSKKLNKAPREVVEALVQDEAATAADTRTEAQKRFDETQRKREEERILKKAAKTHKEKVEELNKYLDSLSEHYDVPKVSWTK